VRYWQNYFFILKFKVCQLRFKYNIILNVHHGFSQSHESEWSNFQWPCRKRRCLWSLILSSWVSWILYGCKPKSRRKIRQVEGFERPSSCARRGIDCLGFYCTLSRTAAILLADLEVLWRTGVFWSFYQTCCLKFRYQTLNGWFWRTTTSAVIRT